MRLLVAFAASLLFLAVAVTPVSAQAPDSLSFQGLLTDSLGSPLDSTNVSITFKLYKNNVAVWTEVQSVDVENGVFNVLLGKVTDLSTLAFDQPIDLGIKLDGESSEISPRTPLAAAAYAKALPGLYTFYRENLDSKSYNVVGGAANNVVDAGWVGATIGGGGGFYLSNPSPNRVLEDFGTIGGGRSNTVSGAEAMVGGGDSNEASGINATVGGGNQNIASARSATVGGGSQNIASDHAATVGGGGANIASGLYATVGGGNRNIASWLSATVGGGVKNDAGGSWATVGGGSLNIASGQFSTTPGGNKNEAQGSYSFAAGYSAKAMHTGTFVWNDRSITFGNDSLLSTGPNQFLIRAAGGVAIGTNSPRAMLTLRGPDESIMGPSLFFFGNSSDQVESGRIRFVEATNSANFRGAFIRYDGSANRMHVGVHNLGTTTTADDLDVITIKRIGGDLGIKRNDPSHPLHVGTSTSNGNGAHVTDSGIWTDASSRTFKMDFVELDKVGLLEQVAQLPVTEWSYNGHEDERHVGPVAEDFYETFGLGSDDKYIGGSDASGVALAAIQGLYELVQDQQEIIETQNARIARLEAAMGSR
jgi:hypothetical protein